MIDGLPPTVTVKDGRVVYAVACCIDPRHQSLCVEPCPACNEECDPSFRRNPGDPFYE